MHGEILYSSLALYFSAHFDKVERVILLSLSVFMSMLMFKI